MNEIADLGLLLAPHCWPNAAALLSSAEMLGRTAARTAPRRLREGFWR